jgi:hypothetical protein
VNRPRMGRAVPPDRRPAVQPRSLRAAPGHLRRRPPAHLRHQAGPARHLRVGHQLRLVRPRPGRRGLDERREGRPERRLHLPDQDRPDRLQQGARQRAGRGDRLPPALYEDGDAFNAATFKQVGSSYLYLRGGWNARALKTFPADVIILDEYDEMDPKAPALARRRMNASLVRRELDISHADHPRRRHPRALPPVGPPRLRAAARLRRLGLLRLLPRRAGGRAPLRRVGGAPGRADPGLRGPAALPVLLGAADRRRALRRRPLAGRAAGRHRACGATRSPGGRSRSST